MKKLYTKVVYLKLYTKVGIHNRIIFKIVLNLSSDTLQPIKLFIHHLKINLIYLRSDYEYQLKRYNSVIYSKMCSQYVLIVRSRKTQTRIVVFLLRT